MLCQWDFAKVWTHFQTNPIGMDISRIDFFNILLLDPGERNSTKLSIQVNINIKRHSSSNPNWN